MAREPERAAWSCQATHTATFQARQTRTPPSAISRAGRTRRVHGRAADARRGWYGRTDTEGRVIGRGDRDSFHIEHMYPQDHCSPAEAVDYTNMAGCQPGRGQPDPTYGAKFKDRKPWPSRPQRPHFLRPTTSGGEARFTYTRDGLMGPVAGDPAAARTITELNLGGDTKGSKALADTRCGSVQVGHRKRSNASVRSEAPAGAHRAGGTGGVDAARVLLRAEVRSSAAHPHCRGETRRATEEILTTQARTEAAFEAALEETLFAGGYHCVPAQGDTPTPAPFSPTKALAFLQLHSARHLGQARSPARPKTGERVLDDLCQMDGRQRLARHAASRLQVLRPQLRVAYFKAAHELNPELDARYAANRPGSHPPTALLDPREESLDIVLSVNGIPSPRRS